MHNLSKNFMLRAIELSMISLKEDGGPFGCVIVKNNEIISEGFNEVTNKNDPTAHAEIVAIRNACKKLNTFNLKGTQMFTSCEPCPMCLSAIYWSHIDKIYYGNNRKDAAKIGFDDSYIYDELSIDLNKRKIPLEQINEKEAIKAFEEWEVKTDKTVY
jgi:tRNA(Arg) A34 adenosine deaminase TadA|tara:strand:+ start:752 stop:1225 length:474 start_codon:yes stop_codon:yes gene_type:complete